MSAPKSIGRSRKGVAMVLSTTRGTPLWCAAEASASMFRHVPGRVSHTFAKHRAGLIVDQWRHVIGAVAGGNLHRNA